MTDKWSGLADLLAGLIAKYASEIGIDELTIPKEDIKDVNDSEILSEGIEKDKNL